MDLTKRMLSSADVHGGGGAAAGRGLDGLQKARGSAMLARDARQFCASERAVMRLKVCTDKVRWLRC